MVRPAASGWTVAVTHPTSNRVIEAEVLDDPTIVPSINDLAEFRFPVRRNEAWLDPGMDDDPAVDAWLDGEAQPVEVVREVNHASDHTELVCKGGVELENRYVDHWQVERPHLAAEDIITNEVSYDADVDTPNRTVVDETLADVSTQSEFESTLTPDVIDPLIIDSGTVESRQISFITDTGDTPTDSSNYTSWPDTDFVDGQGANWESLNQSAEWASFSLGYTIPADDVGIAIRYQTGNSPANLVIELRDAGTDETVVQTSLTPNANEALTWERFTDAHDADLPAGDYYIYIDSAVNGTDGPQTDLVVLYDQRHITDSEWTADWNTVHEDNGHLDGPRLFPEEVIVEFTETPLFGVVAGSTQISYAVTAPNFLQLSNDSGENWFPNDGTEESTTSVDVDFADVGPSLKMRLGLSNHEPSGTRDNATPRLEYDSETLNSYSMAAEYRVERLLLDKTVDAQLMDVLNEIAGEEYIWSYTIKNGNPTISWTVPGQRTADREPDLGAEANVAKQVKTYEQVTVLGSNETIENEPFTLDPLVGPIGGANLENGNIIPNTEGVRDADTGDHFVRGTDYDLDYATGLLRRLDTNMHLNANYEITYEIKSAGTSTIDSPPASPKELVVEVPGIPSDRAAEQLAHVILNVDPGIKDARYEGDLLLPRAAVAFDPLDALTLDGTGLPGAATPLAVRESPELTPEGVQIRVGSRRELEAALSDFRTQVRDVSRRV